MKRNDKGVPVMESEHEHGTMVVVNHTPIGVKSVDEICACVVEGMQINGFMWPKQYFTVLPMPMEVH